MEKVNKQDSVWFWMKIPRADLRKVQKIAALHDTIPSTVIMEAIEKEFKKPKPPRGKSSSQIF